MAVSRARLTAMPHTVRIAPRMAERASEVCTAVCAPSLSLAPRNWDTTTPAPTAIPWLNPMSRKMGEPLEPTAAHKVAHDDGIGGVVQLLQHVAQDQRHREEQDALPDAALCHQP